MRVFIKQKPTLNFEGNKSFIYSFWGISKKELSIQLIQQESFDGVFFGYNI